tara:strand:- start:98 stop:361 length:264 start_codon:yes stop_codon:yes gene_type:complete
MNPDEHEDPTPTYTGEVYITVCVQIEDVEGDSENEVASQALSTLKKLLAATNYEAGVVIEDWDVWQSNTPKGFLELSDDAYDRAKDS